MGVKLETAWIYQQSFFILYTPFKLCIFKQTILRYLASKSPNTSFTNLFYKNIGLLLLVNLIIKPIYILFIDAQVQNSVGENTYGLFFSLYNFCLLFQILLDPGILNYNNQRISKSPGKVESIFAFTLGSKLILVLLFACAIFGGGLIFQFEAHYYPVLTGVILILVLLSFLSYLRSHFSAIGQYKYESWLSGLDKVLMILFIGYFLYVRKEIDIFDYIYGQVSALFIACVVFVFLLRKFFKIKVLFSFRETKSLVKKAMPYALILLLMTLYTRMDGFMLDQLIDDDSYSAGVYATGFRLLDAANMIGILFSVLMLPMFSKQIHDLVQLRPFVLKISQLLFVIATCVTMICVFYSEQIINLIYVRCTEQHYAVFRLLMMSFWAMTLANIFGCLFLAKGRLRAINYLFLFGILLNLVLNLYMIPSHYATGAAWATLVTQFFVFGGQLVLAFKAFRFEIVPKKLMQFIFLFVVIFLLMVLFEELIKLNWLIEVVIISFLMIVLSFLCGFLRLPNGFLQKG